MLTNGPGDMTIRSRKPLHAAASSLSVATSSPGGPPPLPTSPRPGRRKFSSSVEARTEPPTGCLHALPSMVVRQTCDIVTTCNSGALLAGWSRVVSHCICTHIGRLYPTHVTCPFHGRQIGLKQQKDTDAALETLAVINAYFRSSGEPFVDPAFPPSPRYVTCCRLQEVTG